MKMTKMTGWGVFAMLCVLVATAVMAATSVPGDMLYKGKVWFAGPVTVENGQTLTIDSRATLDVNGTLAVSGAAVDGLAFSSGAVLTTPYTSGTLRSSVHLLPQAATDVASITRNVLLNIGDITGNTAFGFGSTNKETRGLMGCFGRTVPADASFSGGGFDTAADFRMINKMTNNAAMGLRGAYIKAKNYSTGTVGGLEGLFVEAVNDGTDDAGESVVIKMGTDASTIDYGIDMDLMATPGTADIRFSNGAIVKNGDANTLTFTEATVDVVGAFTANTIAPDNGLTTNVDLIIGAGTTSTFYFVSGILTNVAAK